MLDGSRVHKWLENRPKSKSEATLLKKLQEYAPFSRSFENVQIFGTPDDIQVVYFKKKRFVKLLEYKTVNHHKLDPYVTCQGVLQVKIYCWILGPILKKLGYNLALVHEVVLYNRKNATYVGKVKVYYNPTEVEKEIHDIFETYRGVAQQIAPNRWKCRVCDQDFKTKCTLLRGTNNVS
jgi:hypothetical protein